MYKKNDIVEGKITGIQKYGVFVNIDNEYTGLIHISEISDYFVKNINDYVSLNQTIKARIIDVDPENKHLKLSIKNLANNNLDNKKGFNSLQKKLKQWINEKMEEIKTLN